jgi:hypothetical protein
MPPKHTAAPAPNRISCPCKWSHACVHTDTQRHIDTRLERMYFAQQATSGGRWAACGVSEPAARMATTCETTTPRPGAAQPGYGRACRTHTALLPPSTTTHTQLYINMFESEPCTSNAPTVTSESMVRCPPVSITHMLPACTPRMLFHQQIYPYSREPPGRGGFPIPSQLSSTPQQA